MPVTIGSVGDIIAVCQLVRELALALNSLRGSSHDFRELVKQLHAFNSVLEEADSLVKRHENSPGLGAFRASTNRVATDCRDSVVSFLGRIKKYQRSLQEGGSGNRALDGVRRVQWKMLEGKDVEIFRVKLISLTSSLQTLIELWDM